MSTLVFVEVSEKKIKKNSLEAISYAYALHEKNVTAIVIGAVENTELQKIGPAGASKIIHVSEKNAEEIDTHIFVSAIHSLFENKKSDTLIFAKSSLSDTLCAKLSVKLQASFIPNVTELPTGDEKNIFKRSIYTGKAFSFVEVKNKKKIISIKKNTIPIKTNGGQAEIEAFSLSQYTADTKITSLSQEKLKGKVLLPEADIVVSAGRGMKGPEHWKWIEELADILGAATACSKPVSDMDWRPHHEHVGQTGLKVSPSLYIAIGISGAIQHLAGVNSSKCIVVINKDPEAPFFKAADYGIAGDAFEILPKLIQELKQFYSIN
ncbi:MAG: electron transfer flavoprotein subunit alpha/FixB family protein [Chitinophagaceae bacterium]|nr:electron transfer flavoprotein subunit alpha/FixB family protein [Chitinophagaceae bacterium]